MSKYGNRLNLSFYSSLPLIRVTFFSISMLYFPFFLSIAYKVIIVATKKYRGICVGGVIEEKNYPIMRKDEVVAVSFTILFENQSIMKKFLNCFFIPVVKKLDIF